MPKTTTSLENTVNAVTQGPGPTTSGGGTQSPEITKWMPVEGSGVIAASTGASGGMSLINSGGKLYAAWVVKFASPPKVVVFNGNPAAPVWTDVSAGLPSSVDRIILASAGGKLYAAYSSSTAVHVAVYGGNDAAPSWAMVDGNVPSLTLETNNNVYEQDIDFTSINGKLYVAFTENDTDAGGNYRVHVKVYNGNDAAPAWALVDGSATGLNTSATSFAYSPIFGARGNSLYLATSEQLPPSGWAHHVLAYNGNDAAPAWSYVDGAGGTTINAADYTYRAMPVFADFNNALYFFFNLTSLSQASLDQLSGSVYGGNNAAPSWADVSGTGADSLGALAQKATSAAVANSKLYLATGPHVLVFNSDNQKPVWTPVDGAGMSSIARNSKDTVAFTQLAVLGGQLYAMWTESGMGNSTSIYVSVGQ
jgi:hypothetical protein